MGVKKITVKRKTKTTKATKPKLKKASKKVGVKKSTVKAKRSRAQATKATVQPITTIPMIADAMPTIAPIQAGVPLDLTMPPASLEAIAPATFKQTNPANRVKLWAAVAVTMVMVVLAWVYALPYNITVPINENAQLSEVGNTNISEIVGDIRNSWNNFATQAQNFSEVSRDTTAVNVNQPTNVHTDTTAPTLEELDHLFTDIN